MLEKLQAHTLERLNTVALPPSARELTNALRQRLLKARKKDELRTPENQIHSLLRCQAAADNRQLYPALQAQGLHDNAFCIFGGEKNFHRDKKNSHFERADGAWFDFTITVHEEKTKLSVLAYDFEIRLPVCHGAPFLRFDLNLPAHNNEARELRCHLHPGCDELLLPAPPLTPLEVLELFLTKVRPEKTRSPTTFEVDWLAGTLERFRQP